MNEKYLLGIGAGLIIISFGIILSYTILIGVDKETGLLNRTIGFEQLGELNYETKKIKNSEAFQEFRAFVGETLDEMKNKVIVTNTTLHSELKNRPAENSANSP